MSFESARKQLWQQKIFVNRFSQLVSLVVLHSNCQETRGRKQWEGKTRHEMQLGRRSWRSNTVIQLQEIHEETGMHLLEWITFEPRHEQRGNICLQVSIAVFYSRPLALVLWKDRSSSSHIKGSSLLLLTRGLHVVIFFISSSDLYVFLSLREILSWFPFVLRKQES